MKFQPATIATVTLRRWMLIVTRLAVVVLLLWRIWRLVDAEWAGRVLAGSSDVLIVSILYLCTPLALAMASKPLVRWLVPELQGERSQITPSARQVVRTMIRVMAMVFAVLAFTDLAQAIGPRVVGTLSYSDRDGMIKGILMAVVAGLLLLCERSLSAWIVPNLPPTDQCPKCGYSRHGLDSPICPECGTDLRPRQSAGKP